MQRDPYPIVSMFKQGVPLGTIAVQFGFKDGEEVENYLQAQGICVRCAG
jgi:methylase of polypeptide subunit release factors